MAFSALERMIAWRYLRARRKEGFVSVIAGFSLLGIMLGVATLIIVMSVMNGFRQEMLTSLLRLNGHLGVYSPTGQPIQNYHTMTDRIERITGVKAVLPFIEGHALASSDLNASGVAVRGYRAEDLLKQPQIAESMLAGSIDSLQEPGTVIVGYRLAEKLGLGIGDKITLISPKGSVTAFGTIPRMQAYRIGGTFNLNMFEYDTTYIFMSMPDAQVYFGMPEAVTHVEILLNDAGTVEDMRVKAAAAVGPGWRIYDWKNANAAFFNALQVERNVMFLILTLIIIVAAFNIISGLIMLVKDKGGDIAILRTMGATRGMIMRIFFMSGAFVGVVGTFSGLLLGLIFCENIEAIRQVIQTITGTELFSAEIYFLSTLPAETNPTEVIAVVLMAIGLSFGATIYPAWRAARLDPVEALRYE